jgi:hypothetical protein
MDCRSKRIELRHRVVPAVNERPSGNRGPFRVDNNRNTSYDVLMKIVFYTLMRGFFEVIWISPDKWLYWDAKLLEAREEAKNGA